MMVSQRYELLFQHFLDDTISPEDYVLLKAWVLDADNTERFDEMIETAIRLRDHNPGQMAEVEMDAVYNDLLAARTAGSRVHLLNARWFRYAAILLLIAATATFLYVNNQSGKETAQAKSTPLSPDILPGGNKAILTLSDGSTILLDSAAIGNLALQGNTTITKLHNGALLYDAADGLHGQLLYNTIRTPKGGQYQVTLPDGTMIWLNAASSVTFPAAFGAYRRITVTGEAYLEVKKDKTKSFIITANGTEVTVLGTSFNINAYQDEAGVKTCLIDGSVKISKDDNVAILKPGEQCMAIAGRSLAISMADTEQALAWKNGTFYFKHTNLADAMRQISRWYDVEVVYDKGVPGIQLGGEMKRDLTLSQMLETLGKLGVDFRLEKNRLIVHNELPVK